MQKYRGGAYRKPTFRLAILALLGAARFSIFPRHDDAAREFAYDAGAEHALAEAVQRGRTAVSMERDLATAFRAPSPTRQGDPGP